MKQAFTICAAIILSCNCLFAGTWTVLDLPGLSATSVSLTGIGGNYIVGYYEGSSDYQRMHGILYNMSTGTWTTIDKPGAGALGTEIRDTDGDKMVGSYYDTTWHGFIYNLVNQSWTTIDVPGNSSMQPYGIDGNYVVGYYWNGLRYLGFVYNIASGTYTTFDKPGAEQIYPQGISGSNIVGYYHDGASFHSFLYNINTQSWTALNAPGASVTMAKGIDGNDIVGYYDSSRSFIYNITTQAWTAFYSPEGSDNIFPVDIHNNHVIFNDLGRYGSVYTISGSAPIVPVCFAPVVGDVNGDCKVDFVDFAKMMTHWLECNLQPPSACWQ